MRAGYGHCLRLDCKPFRFLVECGVRFPKCPQYVLLRSTLKLIIMATTRLNSEQFANLLNELKGVVLVYKSVDREGNVRESAQQFFGEGFEPKNGTQDEIFRVWKNVVITFWSVKAEELKLREANDGIRTNLRATTPSAIIFRTDQGQTIKRFDLEESVWAKVGLIPTKTDFARTARDYKKAIHNAAQASFDALGFRVALPKEDVKPAPAISTSVTTTVQPAVHAEVAVAAVPATGTVEEAGRKKGGKAAPVKAPVVKQGAVVAAA